MLYYSQIKVNFNRLENICTVYHHTTQNLFYIDHLKTISKLRDNSTRGLGTYLL